jgi:hypothetical protein
MHVTTLFRSSFFALALAVTASAAFLPACGNKSDGITAENIEEKGALIEQHDAATIAWNIDGDGNVKALVKTPDGKPIDKNVYGTLTVSGVDPAFVPITMPIAPDPKTGMLTAIIPMPDDEIAVVKYDLKVDGKPVTGAMHLPHGGTAELEQSAKKADEKKLPEGKKGPNGGVVQVVGDDVVEVVAEKSNGSLRVYLLDDDFKPVKVGEKKITIGFVSAKGPETIVLAPDAGGVYFVGKMDVVVNPVKITVAVIDHDDVHVVLCGYHPGKVIVVGAAAPTYVVLVNAGWGVTVVNPTPVIIVNDGVHWHGKGKGKGHWKGKKGGGIHINIH